MNLTIHIKPIYVHTLIFIFNESTLHIFAFPLYF